MMKRRTLALLTALLLVASACGSVSVEVEFNDEQSDDSASEVVVTTTTSTIPADESEEVVEVSVPTGRVALAEAQGGAYALWFWGAH